MSVNISALTKRSLQLVCFLRATEAGPVTFFGQYSRIVLATLSSAWWYVLVCSLSLNCNSLKAKCALRRSLLMLSLLLTPLCKTTVVLQAIP